MLKNQKSKRFIAKILPSQMDKEYLTKKKSSPLNKKITNYKKVVVNKPWGYEYLMFENEHVAIWILYLKEGFSTSIHCHPKKKSSLIVLSGKVVTSFLDKEITLKELDAVMIDSKVFHGTEGISPGGALVMEIETPPDKTDLVRLRDKYGREKKGYETNRHMSPVLEGYDYLDFHEGFDEVNKFLHKNIKKRHIRIQRNNSLSELIEYALQPKKSIICFLDAQLVFKDGSRIFEIGDIISETELRMLHPNKLIINPNFFALIIH